MADNAPLPTDSNRVHVPLVPRKSALAVTVDATISSATDVTLNAGTSFIEVNAVNGGIYMRYAATASAANFDEYIQAGAVRHYYIPHNVSVISFIEETSGAKLILIEK
jgi:hypothetical protein